MNNNNGIVTSSPSTFPVIWEVTNKLSFPIRVQWINFEGKSSEEGFVVQPGQSLKPGTTYVSHNFLVTNDKATGYKDRFVSVINVMGVKTVIG